MKERLRKALAQADVDYCEARVEESHALSISYQGQGLDNVRTSVQHGGNVRALYRGAWGFASFDNLDDLPEMLASACRQARQVGQRVDRDSRLAPVPVVELEYAPTLTLDPRGVLLEEKIRLLDHYSELILGFHESIAAANLVYREKSTTLWFANTEGTFIRQQKLDLGAGLRATARRGSTTVTEGIGLGSSVGFDCMLRGDDQLREACELAVRELDAPPVKAGVYTVICNPALSGLFVHEAFGHLSEADNAYKNPGIAKAMTLGRRLGRPILNIYDTGDDIEHRGYLRYDDEGVETRRADLVRNGVLVGRLHSRETAGIMGEEPTGNARALTYRFPPLVRMRSTCIAPGEASFEELISDVRKGVYAVGSGGGQTNGEMFNFNAGHAFMIRDGKLAGLVRDVKLMGNVFTTLENIDKIGSFREGRDGPGGCGKGGQMPLPTSGRNPHIRIQNVIVGGAKS